ncbi:MAG TPA: hypothetical protein VLA79_01920 [Polyangia bacterium]|nr:hypothetical protein [Polyangia bacterium]
MQSNQKWMLHGALSLAVVLSAAEVRAQKLEAPVPPPADAAPPTSSSGPTGFGDSGQFVLSAETLFGFTYYHPSAGTSSTTYSLLSNGFAGVGVNVYDWPRVAFDYFVTKGISLGGAVSASRTTTGNDSTNAFQIAPRVGYATMVGPWLGVWPRAGVTYLYSASNEKFLAFTVDALAVILVAPHLAITFGPTLDVGLTGNPKITQVGVYFGLAIPF